jgi:hypothetical protein
MAGEFGLGAEIGIGADKLHARGHDGPGGVVQLQVDRRGHGTDSRLSPCVGAVKSGRAVGDGSSHRHVTGIHLNFGSIREVRMAEPNSRFSLST